jgi:hypothetical protein
MGIIERALLGVVRGIANECVDVRGNDVGDLGAEETPGVSKLGSWSMEVHK